MRVALLDDYLGVATQLAPFDRLSPQANVAVFRRHVDDRDELIELLKEVECVAVMRERTPLDRALIEALPNLELIVTSAMRNGSIDLAAATERGIVVSGTEALHHPPAELTWALILALARNVCTEDSALRAGRWQTRLGLALGGRTLGILGLGRIGRQVAQIGLVFGMRVIAWSPNLTEGRAADSGVVAVTKEALLRDADIISLHLRLSSTTEGLLGAEEFALMKRSAYLVNTARGALVDRDALIQALRDRRIAGAGLDVFHTEPVHIDDPLLGLDNVVLTPHLGFVTGDSLGLYYRQMVEDIEAYLAGSPIRVLNEQVGSTGPS